MNCMICGQATTGARKTCSDRCRRKVSSLTMTKTNLIHCSERMIRNNPMRRTESLEKMKISMKGKKFKIRGGNGRGYSKPQLLLYDKLLPFSPKMEFILKTKPLQYLYKSPNHYKLDLAIPSIKLAIEIDGMSHNSLKVQDADKRKEALLNGLGWIILRFTNSEVMNGIDKCEEKILFIISKLKNIIPTSQTE